MLPLMITNALGSLRRITNALSSGDGITNAFGRLRRITNHKSQKTNSGEGENHKFRDISSGAHLGR